MNLSLSILILLSMPLLIFVNSNAFATELENCILSGLRGINSDVAARMVQQTCKNKINIKKETLLFSKFGEPLNEVMEFKDWDSKVVGDKINGTVNFKNNSAKTAIYVEISIGANDEKGICPEPWNYKKFVYKVKLKADSLATFVMPDVGNFINIKNYSACLSAISLRGRQRNLLDFNLINYKPLSDNEVDSLNSQLSMSYGFPAPAPVVAPAFVVAP